MKKKIDNPKVFISYAWSSEDYKRKVLDLAHKLGDNGIKVVIDKSDLREGNYIYAFMERSVKDDSITNVLILIDPIYAKRADEYKGGVGTETQIFQAKVYQDVNQDKFIPIVMERDEEGNVCMPTYLQSRYYFDLSDPKKYEDTYKQLVKTLYGEEVYEKPPTGKRPDWVDESTIPRSYESMNNFEEHLEKIKTRFLDYSEGKMVNSEDYIQLYDKTSVIKKDFLQLIKNSAYLEDSHKKIADFFEKTVNALNQEKRSRRKFLELAKVRIHELFLYVVAYYLKREDFSAAGYMLGKTYSDPRLEHRMKSFSMFHSGVYNRENLDNAIKARDNKKYFTGAGEHWIESLSNEFCSKEQFVFADLICFNYSIYGKDYIDLPWFPITYIYDNSSNSILSEFAKKMKSKEHVQKILPLFGFDTVEAFANKIKEIEEVPLSSNIKCEYPKALDYAKKLRDFFKIDELASLR